MAQMTPFRYVEFYDVPRSIAVHYRGRLLLLQSAFDEQLDDYPGTYSVYALPESSEDSLNEGSWGFLERTPMICIGQIQVNSVEFDPSKRKELDPSCLDGLALPIEGSGKEGA
jgi:hypothetical protein